MELSAKVPIALNCCCPCKPNDTLFGFMVMDTSAGGTMLNEAELLMEFNAAVTVVLPVAVAVARPFEAMVAPAVAVQATVLVMS